MHAYVEKRKKFNTLSNTGRKLSCEKKKFKCALQTQKDKNLETMYSLITFQNIKIKKW